MKSVTKWDVEVYEPDSQSWEHTDIPTCTSRYEAECEAKYWRQIIAGPVRTRITSYTTLVPETPEEIETAQVLAEQAKWRYSIESARQHTGKLPDGTRAAHCDAGYPANRI